MSRTVLHTRGRWKFSLADIKKIFCRSDLWSKSSCVSCGSLKHFPHTFTIASLRLTRQGVSHETHFSAGSTLNEVILFLRSFFTYAYDMHFVHVFWWNENGYIFHSKVYCFICENAAPYFSLTVQSPTYINVFKIGMSYSEILTVKLIEGTEIFKIDS